MSLQIRPAYIVAFTISFLAIGLPFWFTPYDSVTLPNTLITPLLVVVCLAAILLHTLTDCSFQKNLHLVASVLPAVVLIRVIFEGISYPTSHNLWPFELIIATLIGYAVALPSVLIGSFIRKFRKKSVL